MAKRNLQLVQDSVNGLETSNGVNVAEVTGAVTDNAIVRFDGTTGAIQNSGVVVDDSGNLIAPTGIFTEQRDETGPAGVVIDFPNYLGTDGRIISRDTNTSAYKNLQIGALNTVFVNGGFERMRIDSAGNVGIGVTPSAWSSSIKTLEMQNGAFIGAWNATGLDIGKNAYYDTAWKYKANGLASIYDQNEGTHKWFTAPSGTAGNAITWTTAMALGGNGNLLVGTTTDNGVDKLQVNGSISASNVYNETSISVLIPAGATVTQEFSLPLVHTTYAVKAIMDGDNMVLHAFANYHTAHWSTVIVGISDKFIGDYSVGSIDLQTKNNLQQFTYSDGNGLKGQCVVTNGDSVDRNLVIIIKKII